MKTQITKLNKSSGFTLVELIVVVTILSILSTIGFVSYSSYLSGVRDTNRISQLKAIGDSLHLYETKKSLPLPDEKRLEIKDGATTIAIQGYVGKSVIETIGYTSEGKDPKDNTYFSYYLTKDRKYFQLLSFLEDQPETTSKLNNLNKLNNLKTTQAIDYENRYPYVEGKKLGILTTDSNEPIQEVQSGSLDISNVGNTKTYKSYLKTKEVITGNGIKFKDLGKVAKVGGRGYSASGNTIVYKNLDEIVNEKSKIHGTLASDMTGWSANNNSCPSCLDGYTKRFAQMPLLECEILASKHKATMFYADYFQHPSNGSDSWRRRIDGNWGVRSPRHSTHYEVSSSGNYYCSLYKWGGVDTQAANNYSITQNLDYENPYFKGTFGGHEYRVYRQSGNSGYYCSAWLRKFGLQMYTMGVQAMMQNTSGNKGSPGANSMCTHGNCGTTYGYLQFKTYSNLYPNSSAHHWRDGHCYGYTIWN